jgi:predicted transcriptional regulator
MTSKEIAQIIGGEIICSGSNQEINIGKAFASDLMSDVLTIDTDNLLLLTGLNNLQTIRTAEMAEVKCILLVRNKKPSEEMLTLAAKENITIITSEKSLFYVSGLLYSAGIKPVY